jgi:type II secretory pathway predicted ATPase ExeA
MMYLDHFGLQQAPFRITPHTEFFFAGANRGATLEALIYAITHDEGIVKVSGEVGSGKTMLCRMLLERLPDNVETVYLANPMLSRTRSCWPSPPNCGCLCRKSTGIFCCAPCRHVCSKSMLPAARLSP